MIDPKQGQLAFDTLQDVHEIWRRFSPTVAHVKLRALLHEYRVKDSAIRFGTDE